MMSWIALVTLDEDYEVKHYPEERNYLEVRACATCYCLIGLYLYEVRVTQQLSMLLGCQRPVVLDSSFYSPAKRYEAYCFFFTQI